MMAGQDQSPQGLETAVLFLIFNRPDLTQKVFAEIRKARPKRLYVAADGPRNHVVTDASRCAEARQVLGQVDWPCAVHTLLRDENLGCKRAVSSAITWLFENEEEGIILEDDCVPARDFFPFCQQLLKRYRNESRIKAISGTSVSRDAFPSADSYIFSRHISVWGWATWRRVWEEYDIEMKEWPDLKKSAWLDGIFPETYMRRHWQTTFDLVHDGKLDTWDVQFVYSCLRNDGVAIVPPVNLISNIGVEGTHTTPGDTKRNFLPVGELAVDNMEHPAKILVNETHDTLLFERLFKPTVQGWVRNAVVRVVRRAKKMIDK
ncbi:MAG: hypothetical protein KIT50_10655 [Bacteroidetes bacterium]|nr:hypothetical protein [Bacteroidota bacterium]